MTIPTIIQRKNTMSAFRSLFYFLLRLPIKLLVHSKIVPDNYLESDEVKPEQPQFYVLRHQSASDILSLRKACKSLKLPDPLSPVTINGQSFSRLLCLEKPTPLFRWRKAGNTEAITQGFELLKQHRQFGFYSLFEVLVIECLLCRDSFLWVQRKQFL